MVSKPPVQEVLDSRPGSQSGSLPEPVPGLPSMANTILTAMPPPKEWTHSRAPGTAEPFRLVPPEAAVCHSIIRPLPAHAVRTSEWIRWD